MNPSAAIMADPKLEHAAREALKRIAERVYESEDELNELATEEAGKEAHAFLAAMSVNAQSAIQDVADKGELVVQHHVFRDVWALLANASDNYLSVCDLSPFYDLFGTELHEEARRWDERLEREIEHLRALASKGTLNRFDKIIVYVPRKEPPHGWGEEGAPACASGSGACSASRCKVACMVQSVTKKWVDSDLDDVLQSHAETERREDQSGVTWTAHRHDFDDALWLVNDPIPDETKKISSADIGLFGESIVGEEFKFMGERFQLKREPLSDVRPQTPSISVIDANTKRPFGYVYKFRRASELNGDLRRRITGEMNRDRHIRRAV
ncbi:MAG: hypothetical protein R3C25_10275 [Hyphomonadaceae bacterium]